MRGDDVLTEDSIVVDLGAPGFDAAVMDFESTATISSPASNTVTISVSTPADSGDDDDGGGEVVVAEDVLSTT